VIVSPVPSLEESSASDEQDGGKAMPFGLPCITDEKLLILMAQNSVNGRLAALQATSSPVDTSLHDEPATVPVPVGGSVTGRHRCRRRHGRHHRHPGRRPALHDLADGYRLQRARGFLLEIFNPSLVRVGHDDDGGVGRNSVMTITAAVSGTYTIRASAFGSAGAQGVGQYTVDVRQMGTDSVPATLAGAVPIGQGSRSAFARPTPAPAAPIPITIKSAS
jgi:hypothetical protein